MDYCQTRLAEVLGRYDEQNEPFTEVEVQCSLEKILPEVRAAGPVPAEIEAEVLAFAFSENYSRDKCDWGTYYGPMFSGPTKDGSIQDYPSLDQVTPVILDYWATRAVQVKHPYLQFRYAGLVWDLSAKVRGTTRRPELARLMVDAAVAIAERLTAPPEGDVDRQLSRAHHEFDAFRKLERALDVAISLNDFARVEVVRNSLLRFEERTARDHLIGTWGRCFDLLVEGDNKRFPLPNEQRDKLIADLETRLEQLAGETDSERLDPRAVEAAALRLAGYYRRRQQQDDMVRVLTIYADAHLRKAEVVSGLVAASTLQQVCDTLFDFGLRVEAEVVAGCYRRHAERTKKEMNETSHTTTIPAEEIEEFLRPWSEGELSDLLALLAVHFIPQRADAEKRVHELAQQFPVSHLVTTAILDHEGRQAARVGSVDQDMGGHIVRNISQTMAFTSPFLRMVVERLVSAHRLDAERVAEFLAHSPVFDPEQRSILDTGLRAYFSQDWLVAVHLLVPQIESAVRRLLRLMGGSGLKQGRNGTMPLKTLDDILRDQGVERVLDFDVASYFRILLTDQRGWNVRNSVCHGLTRADQFHPAVADRLFHALLCLGLIQAQPGPEQAATEPLTTRDHVVDHPETTDPVVSPPSESAS